MISGARQKLITANEQKDLRRNHHPQHHQHSRDIIIIGDRYHLPRAVTGRACQLLEQLKDRKRMNRIDIRTSGSPPPPSLPTALLTSFCIFHACVQLKCDRSIEEIAFMCDVRKSLLASVLFNFQTRFPIPPSLCDPLFALKRLCIQIEIPFRLSRNIESILSVWMQTSDDSVKVCPNPYVMASCCLLTFFHSVKPVIGMITPDTFLLCVLIQVSKTTITRWITPGLVQSARDKFSED